MLALVLVGALIAQAFGAPSNCAEFCDDQSIGSSAGYNSQARSSYSSYAKSSSYNHGSQRLSGTSGLGSSAANLETLDENAIGVVSPSADRPGSWRDEKHYVTDDGRGQMSYRAGQTVTGNGYSKFAEHSYSYGTHESHAPQANSQILSTADFNRELQNLRGRINQFMGTFHVGADSFVDAALLQDFKSKASLISNQLTNVCNQVDSGSSMYQQMHQMQQEFLKNVERIQQQMESIIFQSSGSSSGSVTEIVQQPYPTAPTYVHQTAPSNPAPIQQIPDNSQQITDAIVHQVHEKLDVVNNQISSFYKIYSAGQLNVEQRSNIVAQANDIIQKLTDLETQAIVRDDLCTSISQQKKNFQNFYTGLLNHIQELENRALIDQRAQITSKLQEESTKFADNKRILEEQQAELERQIQLKKQEHEQLVLQLKAQEEFAKKQQEEAKKQQEENRRRQEEFRRLEELRLQRIANLKQQQEVEQVQPVKTTGSLVVSGSSSYEHSIKTSGSISGSSGGASSGTYGHESYVRPTQAQPVYSSIAPAHIDVTALTSKLQQDLYRIQNDISNFNMYTMRLTAANSESVIAEAERQAESLRQRITSLCQTSDRYENQNIHSSAEALQRRFEDMVRNFQSTASNYASGGAFAASAGYSSQSSWGSSGSAAAVQAPSITNIEYEHSKSTDVEVSKRPVSSQRYVQHHSGYNGQQVDCVEAYAGQPCVDQQPRRYRRQAGGN